MEKLLAWAVHAYTALGLVTGFAAIHAATRGDVRVAFLLLAASTAIDATDGPLARRFRVAQLLPHFRGRTLDDIVDFLNYVVVPSFILAAARLLPPPSWAWALVPLVASAYGFSQARAKTPDGFFTGFPSYWNVVVFYIVFFGIAPASALAIVVAFAVMVFVPLRYIDPFKTRPLRRLTVSLTLLWAAGVVRAVVAMPSRPSAPIVWLMIAYPVYYMAASFLINARRGCPDR